MARHDREKGNVLPPKKLDVTKNKNTKYKILLALSFAVNIYFIVHRYFNN